MVIGNVAAGVFMFLPLVFVGVVPFAILRAAAGLATAMYDPAARGYITDATPPDHRGEAFGLYGAAQMGGLLLGPAIGGFGASLFGGVAFIFVFGALATFLAAAAIAIRVRERPHTVAERSRPFELTEMGAQQDLQARATQDSDRPDASAASLPAAPASLVNRWLIAAILFTIGGSFAFGTYEVIWSLYLQRLGAGLELIGLTFAMFALPILVLSPWFGRRVDRSGLTPFLIAGTVLPVVAALAYTVIRDPWLSVPLILVESTGAAVGSPAVYTVIASGSPIGRSSTAQGIVGASGTLAFVVASLAAGAAAEIEIRLPFYLFAVVMTVMSGAAFLVAWPRLRERAASMAAAAA